jgi:serine protease Do
MFDLNGNVIGIATALISPTGGNVGIGFAIPAEQIGPVVNALRRGERVRRGYIGVSLQPLDEGVAAALGIDRNRGELIRAVTPGGPAARAGVQQGDVVISVAGQPVNPDQSLAYLVSQQPIGTRIPLELIRQGQRRTVTVAIAERPTEEELARINGIEDDTPTTTDTGKDTPQSSGQRSAQESLGVSVQTLTPDIARRLQLSDANLRGIVVVSVDPNSDAAAKGLQPGDVILSINQTPTATPEAAASVVAASRRANRSTVLLLIRRGNAQPAYVGIELSRR